MEARNIIKWGFNTEDHSAVHGPVPIIFAHCINHTLMDMLMKHFDRDVMNPQLQGV